MASSSPYSLSSTKTAIAIILPSSHSSNVNNIRRVHDKAYHKWPPHINILYPALTVEQLQTALPIFQKTLQRHTPFKVDIDRVGTFTHRHNATVFLQPSETSEQAISRLREQLVSALGLSNEAGTLDGTFRPHMTLGQASLKGPCVERLVEKCSPLTGLQWEVAEFAALVRKPTGEMEVAFRIPLGPTGNASDEKATDEIGSEAQSRADMPVWSRPFSYTSEHGWQLAQDFATDDFSEGRPISILSYNLLADRFGYSFAPRLPLVINAIRSAMKPNLSEVVCLQEITNNMLEALLSHPFIQSTYPFCSHTNSSILMNDLNLVALSNQPFQHTMHCFDQRHKASIIIRPQSAPFEIANVHLTAALKDHAVAARQQQIESITSLLERSTNNSRRHPVIAGDFNSATSSITIQQALRKGEISFTTSLTASTLIDPDVWHDAYLESCKDVHTVNDVDGATFDVQRNPLAAESNAPADQRPQRYDRILFSRNAPLTIDDFKIFGLPSDSGRCGSDHFGISAILRPTTVRQERSLMSPVQNIEIVDASDSEDSLAEALGPHLPSDKDREQRQKALACLNETLCKDVRLSDIAIMPLGSYALNTYFADSDIDVLVIGSLPSNSFFKIATTRLQLLSGNDFKGIHFINALVPVIEVEILGIKFDIQYSHAPEIVAKLRLDPTLSAAEVLTDTQVLTRLSPAVLRPLNTYRDAAYILQSNPCIHAFRKAHRYLSLFLRRRGLYSAKIGYLGGVHLSLLLNYVVKSIDKCSIRGITASSLVRTFLTFYATFDWEAHTVSDPSCQQPNYKRTSREPVSILAIHSPSARPNVASSCTQLSAKTFSKEFALASSKLAEGDWTWMLRSRNDTFEDFKQSFGAFIVLTIDMWDLQRLFEAIPRGFMGHAESRIPMIMVLLGRIPGLYAQAWLYQLSQRGDASYDGSHSKQHYIIGLSASLHADASERKLVEGKVIQVAQNFESILQTAQQYDPNHMLVHVELKNRKYVADMQLSCD